MTPSEEFQKVVYDILISTPAITDIVPVERITDDAAVGMDMPYISFGQANYIEDDADCVMGTEHFLMIDVYSRYPGGREIKRLCDLIKRALHRVDVEFTDNALNSMWVEMVDIFGDPADSITRHGVIRVEALIEEPL